MRILAVHHSSFGIVDDLSEEHPIFDFHEFLTLKGRSEIPKADLVIGSYPTEVVTFDSFLFAVDAADAKVFVLETIPSFQGTNAYIPFVQASVLAGYKINSTWFDDRDFGLDEERRRWIAIGARDFGKGWTPPETIIDGRPGLAPALLRSIREFMSSNQK